MSTTPSWSPITLQELEEIVRRDLQGCSPEDLELYNLHRLVPRKVPFRGPAKLGEVYVIAEIQGRYIFYDDVEDAFEVALLDHDGVLNFEGVGQFRLCHALAHIRLGWR